jgi:hypothetical protein
MKIFKKIETLFVILVLSFAVFNPILGSLALADSYAKTTIYVNVPSDTSFTMTVLGCGDDEITGPDEPGANATSGDISFNSSTATENFVQAQSVGGCGSPSQQSDVTTPIITLDPTGNIEVNFTFKLDNTSAIEDLNIWANGTTEGAGCSGAGVADTPPLNDTAGYVLIAYNISQTDCQANVTMYCNFSSSPLGTRNLGSMYTKGEDSGL